MPRGPTPRQAVALNEAEKEMSSTSHVAKADDIELQEITENVARSTENLTEQLEGESSEDLDMISKRSQLVSVESVKAWQNWLTLLAKRYCSP